MIYVSDTKGNWIKTTYTGWVDLMRYGWLFKKLITDKEVVMSCKGHIDTFKEV